MEARWRIGVLGGLRVERGDRAVARFRSQKAAALLAYLAYFRHRTHPREQLIELLWPECDLETGRHRLSMALSALRQDLPGGDGPEEALLVASHFAVGLYPAGVVTDAEEFEQKLDGAAADPRDEMRLLSAAVALYRGELLPGFYDEWIFPEQQRLAGRHFQALHRLARLHEEAGDVAAALDCALRAVGADRLREEAHRDLMRLHAAAGEPEAALRQYAELQRILKQELGEAPSTATRELAQQIRRSTRGTGPRADLPIVRAEPAVPHTAEPAGGAVPLDSPFYVERPTDEHFRASIARGDSIVLVKGPQGVGKTSLLARGLQAARELGARVVQTDFAKLSAAQLESPEAFFLAVAEELADQLELDVLPEATWRAGRSPGANLERYVRRAALAQVPGTLVWGLDEIDRLFQCDFGGEAFLLFRAWHNERALDPGGPWNRLTLAIAYATEAHLFITDLNKSPFNVGTRMELEDFTLAEVADLNNRCGTPLDPAGELEPFHRLVGGHPYLVRRGLQELATGRIDLAALKARADGDDGIFGDHLRRMRDLLLRDAGLCAAVREVLEGRPCPDQESFYRLRSAGIVRGDTALDVRPRCPLYAAYLSRRLPAE